MNNILKTWLKKNELTPNKNDFTTVVSSMGSINQAGLIEAIREEGTELIVSQYNFKISTFESDGVGVFQIVANSALASLRTK